MDGETVFDLDELPMATPSEQTPRGKRPRKIPGGILAGPKLPNMADRQMTDVQGIRAAIASGTKVSKRDWLASRTETEFKAWESKKRKRTSTGRRGKGRSGYGGYKRPRYNNGGARPLIVSAGTARSIGGLGAYGFQGGIEGELFGQKYNARGFYDSSDVGGATVSGYGEYNVKKNSLLKLIDVGTNPPRVSNASKGEATIINHREYLGDLMSGSGSPTDFTLQTFALNAGNSRLFPFLGSIAHKFQEWVPQGILVELKTLSSDYAAALSMGSMFMSADYNSLSAAPLSKRELENMEFADSCKPSRSLIMPIECDPRISSNTHLNVAVDGQYEGGDKRLFDLCNIFIGSQGIPTANTPIAEIWLTYEIALYKPIIRPGEDDVISAHYTFSGVKDGFFFGDQQSLVAGSSNGFSLDASNPAALFLNFPPIEAQYLVLYQANSGNPAIVDNVGPSLWTRNGALTILTNFSGVAGPNAWNYARGGEYSTPMGGTASETLMLALVVKMTRPTDGTAFTGNLEFDDSITWSVTGWADMYITQINSELIY